MFFELGRGQTIYANPASHSLCAAMLQLGHLATTRNSQYTVKYTAAFYGSCKEMK